MSTKPMMDSIVEAVENERTRIDLVLRRADASAAESYGQLKKVFCRVQKKTKPMGKTMDGLWDALEEDNEDAFLAVLREVRREAGDAVIELLTLAAWARRAEWSLLGCWEPPADEGEGDEAGPEPGEIDESTEEVTG